MIVDRRPMLPTNPREWSTTNVAGIGADEMEEEYVEEVIIEEEIVEDDFEEEDAGEGFELEVQHMDMRVSTLSCDIGEFDWDSYIEEEEAREEGEVAVVKASPRATRVSCRPSARFVPTMLKIGENEGISDAEEMEEGEQHLEVPKKRPQHHELDGDHHELGGLMDKPCNRHGRMNGSPTRSAMHKGTDNASLVSKDVSNVESVLTERPSNHSRSNHSRIDMTGLIIVGETQASDDEEIIEDMVTDDDCDDGDCFVLNLVGDTRVSTLSCDMGEFDWDAYVHEEELKQTGNVGTVVEKKALSKSTRNGYRPSARFVPSMLEIMENQEVSVVQGKDSADPFRSCSTSGFTDSGKIDEDLNSLEDGEMTGFMIGDGFQHTNVPADEDIAIDEAVGIEGSSDMFLLKCEKRDTRISALSFDAGEFNWDAYVDEEEARGNNKDKGGEEIRKLPRFCGVDAENRESGERRSNSEKEIPSRIRGKKSRDVDSVSGTDSVDTSKSKRKIKRRKPREKSTALSTDDASKEISTEDALNDGDSLGTSGTQKSKRKNRSKLVSQRSRRSVCDDASSRDGDSVGTYGTQTLKRVSRLKLRKDRSQRWLADGTAKDGDSVDTFGTQKTGRKDNRTSSRREVQRGGNDSRRAVGSSVILAGQKERRKRSISEKAAKSSNPESDGLSQDLNLQPRKEWRLSGSGDADSVGTNGTCKSKSKHRRGDKKRCEKIDSRTGDSKDSGNDNSSGGTPDSRKSKSHYRLRIRSPHGRHVLKAQRKKVDEQAAATIFEALLGP
eukprot:scaffold333_cov133-Cylindrotheca_fusiformis.AAC.31